MVVAGVCLAAAAASATIGAGAVHAAPQPGHRMKINTIYI